MGNSDIGKLSVVICAYTTDRWADLIRSVDAAERELTDDDELIVVIDHNDELFDLATFIGVSRPGVPLTPEDISHLPADKVTLLEVPAMAISSTDCRQRVSDGEPVWYLVPDGVVQYINKYELYTDDRE